jgi:hypothetical protein
MNERNRRLTSDYQISLEQVELRVPQRFRGRHPSLCLEGHAERALAAATSRLGRKSTVLPQASTARAIEVRPSAANLHIGLIHAPRAADWGVRSDSNASRTRERSAGPSVRMVLGATETPRSAIISVRSRYVVTVGLP